MKLIGIAGSPRRGKSSKFFLEQCLDAAKIDLDVELIELAGLNISGCIACDLCKKGVQCSQEDDFLPILEKLSADDVVGIVLASPVYMGAMTSQMKAFIDRTVVFRRNGFMFRDKIGAAIAVGGSRNGGQELTIQGIHAGMMIHDMIIVGDGGHFGGIAWGNNPDGYEKDTEGINTARMLGQKIASVATKLNN
ncbi:MAG: flavodoxin family protein [Desulfotalea sp.]